MQRTLLRPLSLLTTLLGSTLICLHHNGYWRSVRKQHNQVEAVGHAALLLTYTITLILRNDADAFLQESFPREGYGIFIVFIYAVVLPLPTIINFVRDSQAQEEVSKVPTDLDADRLGEFSNPLSGDVEDTGAMQTTIGDSAGTPGMVGGATASASGAMLSRMAKVQREKQAFQAQIKDSQAELLALRKENEALKQQQGGQQSVVVQQPAGGEEDGTTAEPKPGPPSTPKTPAEAQGYTMKEVIADESLSEETRQAAQEKLEGLIATQLLQSQMMADAITTEKQAEVQQRERNVILRNVAAEARFSSQYLATLQQSQAPRQTLVEWLQSNRLMHHEQSILDVAGEHTSVEDFEFLNEDDLAEITAKMTRVEGLRFSKAMKKLVATSAGDSSE